MKSFKVLLKILVAIISILNEEGFKVYDSENRDFYISNIEYCKVEDRLIFNCKEDK